MILPVARLRAPCANVMPSVPAVSARASIRERRNAKGRKEPRPSHPSILPWRVPAAIPVRRNATRPIPTGTGTPPASVPSSPRTSIDRHATGEASNESRICTATSSSPFPIIQMGPAGNEPPQGACQPPRNTTAPTMLTATIAAYSATKKNENRMPLYSV